MALIGQHDIERAVVIGPRERPQARVARHRNALFVDTPGHAAAEAVPLRAAVMDTVLLAAIEGAGVLDIVGGRGRAIADQRHVASRGRIERIVGRGGFQVGRGPVAHEKAAS
ncbi:hypothetical protein D3C72_2208350 [compost metagenome]